jgi:DNA-binding NtrC family response regulator
MIDRASQEKILLIDDDDYIAGSLRRYLVAEDYDVDVAVDASAAEALMVSQKYGVVMVDPYLTGAVHDEDGVLLRSVRNLQPSASLIVLTAYGSDDLATTADACRVTAFLRKPQSVMSLTEAIAAASKIKVREGSK